MAEVAINRGGVLRCFAEFDLLPDMLLAHRDNPGAAGVWPRLLDDNGYSKEHIEDGFVSQHGTMTETMAADADRFCRWMGLIGEDGDLSPAGEQLARVGERPPEVRNKIEPGLLTRVLATQIRDCYLAENDFRVVDLLWRAGEVMQWPDFGWPEGLQGLLLCEMETLVHWSFVDAAEADALTNRLPMVREEVIRALRADPEVRAGRETVDAEVIAETIAEVHWRREALSLNSELTLTEMRATALALIFAELLEQSLNTLPLQVLRPWSESGRAG